MNRVAYQNGYAYKLVEDYGTTVNVRPPASISTRLIDLSKDGALLIRAGYAWDGASGMPDSPDVIRGSLVHDALYQLMREGALDPLLQKSAVDRQLYDHCVEDGMNPGLARVVLEAVTRMGGSHLRKDPKWTLYAPPAPAEFPFPDREAP